MAVLRACLIASAVSCPLPTSLDTVRRLNQHRCRSGDRDGGYDGKLISTVKIVYATDGQLHKPPRCVLTGKWQLKHSDLAIIELCQPSKSDMH